MLDLLSRWTRTIRADAPPAEREHLFLARVTSYRTRSLASEHVLNLNLVRFLADHEETIGARFTLQSLRPTVINLVHHLFDGDLLATAEAGQHGISTLVDHYLSDGARKVNDELLVPAVHALDAWWRTGGLSDAREDRRRGGLAAATPGFSCADRYDSRMPGQRPGRLCTANGMCPNCRLGQIDRASPQAYAFVRKLREAIERSRARMPAESWQSRWAPILDRIDTHTERLFTPGAIRQADLAIPSLPTVE